MTYQPEVNTTPAVRVVAARCGVDLHAIEGTGAGGRIRVADVTAACAALFRAGAAQHGQDPDERALYAALFGNQPASGLTPDERAVYAALFGAGAAQHSQADPLSAFTVSALDENLGH